MRPATGIYSCDDHLDLRAVPPGLWESRLPRVDAERGPHVVERDGESVWVCEGRVLGGSGNPRGSDLLKSLNAIGRAGIDDDGFRAGNPELRLQDMDRDGLSASVIYGPLALGLPIADPVLQTTCYAAWNDWAIEEFNAVAPDRLCALAFLPGHSPEAAAAELERSAALGHRGAIIDVFAVDVGDSGWDRLWAAAEHTGLPVSFHLKGGTSSGLSYRMGEWQSAAFATVLPLQLDEPLATMMFCGALERHPGLTLVLAESGVGWLPYFLAQRGPGVAQPPRKDRRLHQHPAQRALPPPGDGDLRGGCPRHGAHPVAGCRLVHVGVGLPAHRQHLPELARRDRGDARCPARGRSPQTHRDQLRRAVPIHMIRGFDHVSLPMRRVEEMVAFYRSLGVEVVETPHLVSVHVGDQMINFHQPATWQREGFTLRAPAAEPPCGDLCFVWDDSPESLQVALDAAGVDVIEGPVARRGARREDASSVYVRDPDGNLVEFMIYP